MNEQNLAAAQRRDLIAGTRKVLAENPGAVMLCASCDNEATPFSCYCDKCEEDMYGPAFSVGDRVHARTHFGTDRFGRIARIEKNSLGTTCYVLEDGGIFGENELTLAR